MNFVASVARSGTAALKRRGAAAPRPNKSVAGHSKTWTFFEDDWHEGNVPIMGPRTHAAWLGSMVFDGARAFEGVTPDLDRHFTRVNRSAENFLLQATVSVDTWMGLAADG